MAAATLVILTGGKTSGKSYAASAAQSKFGVDVIEQDEAIADLKAARRDRLTELQLRKGTAGELIKSGFLDEPESRHFLQEWYERRLSSATSSIIVVEGWFSFHASHRFILYNAATAALATAPITLISYIPSDDDASERFEKRKGRPPRAGEIERRREKYEDSFQEPDDSEPLDDFVRVSTLSQVLGLIASLRD